MKIKDLMDRDLTSIMETRPVIEVIEVLARHRLSGIPVVDDNGELKGFITEKDIVKSALPGYFEFLTDATFIPDFGQFFNKLKKIAKEPVSKYMKKNVVTISEDDSDFHAAMILIKNNLKRAPVVRNGVLIGAVARTDLLEHIMREYEEGAFRP